jgi:hypothetical protein
MTESILWRRAMERALFYPDEVGDIQPILVWTRPIQRASAGLPFVRRRAVVRSLHDRVDGHTLDG